jgi:hypothetical protein
MPGTVTFRQTSVVKRWALVVRRSDRGGTRRKVATAVAIAAVLIGFALAGRVLASDPVGYGVPFWPFANGADQAESQAMSGVATAARTQARPLGDLAGVPSAVVAAGVEVLDSKIDQPTSAEGSVWLKVRLHLPAGATQALGLSPTRCREVVILGNTGIEVNSRRVPC